MPTTLLLRDVVRGWAKFRVSVTLFQPGGRLCPQHYCLSSRPVPDLKTLRNVYYLPPHHHPTCSGIPCYWAVIYFFSNLCNSYITNSGQAVMYYIQYKNVIKSGHCSYNHHFFLLMGNSRFHKKIGSLERGNRCSYQRMLQ